MWKTSVNETAREPSSGLPAIDAAVDDTNLVQKRPGILLGEQRHEEVTGITAIRGRSRIRLSGLGVRGAMRVEVAAHPRDPGLGACCRAIVWVLIISIAAGSTACARTSVSEERDAAVYATVVRWFLAGLDPATPIFLDGQDGIEIDLVVQAEVLLLLEDFEVVRFIDTLSEAVDETLPGAPVRAMGIFVRLGSISGDRKVSVIAGRYISEDETATYVFTLGRPQAEWEIEGSPDLVQFGG